MTTALYVSLGHNSSAVLAIDKSVIVGYEEERLNRVKSSSAYPKLAIEKCMRYADSVDTIYISHWWDQLRLESNKYLDMDHIAKMGARVETLTREFTHHDAHASSALSFYRSVSGREVEDADIVVLDGFGTFQECLSVYRVHGLTRPNLVHRTYGYQHSLGLMYQYTTSYLGMKENQDEYKLLGYEAHVLTYVDRSWAEKVQKSVRGRAREHANLMVASDKLPLFVPDTLIDYNALRQARAKWYEQCNAWRQLFPSDLPEHGVRACIAFCAQTFIEECVASLIDELCPAPMGKTPPVLILTGGCFYNVKLNRHVMNDARRRIFPHALAGDQGAALGHTLGLHTSNLAMGDRIITGRNGQLPIGVEVWNRGMWQARVLDLLGSNRIVNVVREGMEFGPRALCNTTTFALPTQENVRRINQLNERDDAMPMAPVITADAAFRLFVPQEFDWTMWAHRFMITTCAFEKQPPLELRGVAHKDPLQPVWTARPQVVREYTELGKLLQNVPNQTLINTSFNYHGEPIVYSEDDACKTHTMQTFRAQQLGLTPPITILVRS